MYKSVKIRAASLLLAAMLCASCSGNTVSSSVNSFSQTVTATAESVTAAAESSASLSVSESSVSVSETAEKTTSEVSQTTTQTSAATTTVTAVSSEISETVSETSETTTTVLTTTSETTAESTTVTSVSSTEQETQLLSETTVPAAEGPPAEIKVSAVSSPCTLAEKAETAFIDYSNASDGYISAAYSGASARAKLRIVCGGVTCDHDLSVTGEAEYFPLMQGSGDYRIQIFEQYDGKMYMCVLDLSVTLNVSDEVKMYLYPNRYSMFDESSRCVKKSAEVCGGANDDIEKITAVFAFITDNITYDYDFAATVQSGYIPDPDKVLAAGKGICFDYASLFAAMCRSQGIPTRLVIGYAEKDIYHAWNEVYTEETGWITPELLLKNKGYNIVDATFYAGAEDKEYIAAYISDSGNYSSVYRY